MASGRQYSPNFTWSRRRPTSRTQPGYLPSPASIALISAALSGAAARHDTVPNALATHRPKGWPEILGPEISKMIGNCTFGLSNQASPGDSSRASGPGQGKESTQTITSKKPGAKGGDLASA